VPPCNLDMPSGSQLVLPVFPQGRSACGIHSPAVQRNDVAKRILGPVETKPVEETGKITFCILPDQEDFDHDALDCRRTFVRELLRQDLASACVALKERINLAEIRRRTQKVYVAVRSWHRQAVQFLCPSSEEPNYELVIL
jgi:hypothetical protein